jgi:glycosyltransferase involved in cell wall biosynthesis
MNIVMIGPFAFKPKATVSGRAYFMARALVKHGHQVTILMPPYDNLSDSGRFEEREGVSLENMRIRHDDAWQRLIVPLRMARRATQLRADAIHVFKPIGYSGIAAMFLRWFSRRPLVLDTDDWEGTGGWNDTNPYPALWKRFFNWQERWVARHADSVTVASRTLQTQVWGFGVEPTRVFYLPNGPDVHLREQAPVSDEQRAAIREQLGIGAAPFALYVGNIPLGTDLDLAIDAMARVHETLPTARLVIAGDGEGLPGLQAHAQAVGMANRVIFAGWIERDQVLLYLAAADLFVNPYRDSLIIRSKCAVKGAEAMAMGKAVVTSRAGENLEYIEHRYSGLLTEPGDADDLARAMLSVLSDPEWAAELGRNARQRIWAKFGWDGRIAKLEQAYQIAFERSENAGRR